MSKTIQQFKPNNIVNLIYMDAKSDLGDRDLTPKRRLTMLIKNYKHSFNDTPSATKQNQKKSKIPVPASKTPLKRSENTYFVYPSNLELIQKIKKFKSINQSFSSQTDTSNSFLRNSHLAYGKMSPILQQKINNRKNFVEYELPGDPGDLDKLLRTIKETERVIRQENGFINKIRKFKPKIQLKHKIKAASVELKSPGTTTGRRRNKTPIELGRSGILVSLSTKVQ